MTHPNGLDEQLEEVLISELRRRKRMRAKGLCDYCCRPPSTGACKFPDRHVKIDLDTDIVI